MCMYITDEIKNYSMYVLAGIIFFLFFFCNFLVCNIL